MFELVSQDLAARPNNNCICAVKKKTISPTWRSLKSLEIANGCPWNIIGPKIITYWSRLSPGHYSRFLPNRLGFSCRATQDLDQASLQHILKLATKQSHKAMKFQTKRNTHALMQHVLSYILPRRTEEKLAFPSQQHIEFTANKMVKDFFPHLLLQPQCQKWVVQKSRQLNTL